MLKCGESSNCLEHRFAARFNSASLVLTGSSGLAIMAIKAVRSVETVSADVGRSRPRLRRRLVDDATAKDLEHRLLPGNLGRKTQK